MDFRGIINHLKEHGKKYRFPALILLLGIILMTLPKRKKGSRTSPNGRAKYQPNRPARCVGRYSMSDPRGWKGTCIADGGGR